jgi:DNA polymerase-1
MQLLFDIETNGFLEHVSLLHVIVLKDVKTKKRYTNLDTPIPELLDMLQKADRIIGHNIIKYDIPVLTKLHPQFKVKLERVFDTLVCSRLIWPNIGDSDNKRIQDGRLPSKLWGSQSLEAWGYRLGQMKGEYTKDFVEQMGDAYVKGSEWLEWSQDMHDYCIQDVEVTEALYELILGKNYSQQAMELEHHVAHICAKMERSGWPFDVNKAVVLYGHLAQKRDEILRQMTETFEPEVIERWSEKTGKRLKDKVVVFNPGSRKQIADRLIRKYTWKPTDYTDGGQVKIDETVLSKLEYPEAKILAEYFTLLKRVGQIAEGDNAWLKLERKGKLHGGYNPNGAVTGRATHQTPNIAQVPAVGKEYGKECRELFTVPAGFELLGVDLSGIELRLLAHYMFSFDQGKYAKIVIQGKQSEGTDVHTTNMRAFDLYLRKSAKTAIYAMLYGCAGMRMFKIADDDAREAGQVQALANLVTDKQKRAYGAGKLDLFLQRTPALKKLKEKVATMAAKGYVRGLDGRFIHVRSDHAALNSLLQGAGGCVAKQWLIEIVKAADEKEWLWNEDWSGDFVFCGWIHDEVQIGVRSGIAKDFGDLVVKAAAKAGVVLGLKVPVGAEFSIGKTWADTH